MKTATFLLVLSGCASVGPLNPVLGDCGVMAAGDIDDRLAPSSLTQRDVQRGVMRTLDGASFTTDFRLGDPTQNCQNLAGYRIYTKKQFMFMSEGIQVYGYTQCFTKTIVLGTPTLGNWIQSSAIIHELFHALQNCDARTNIIDKDEDKFHANWVRDGIYWAIDYETALPVEK